jgi:4-amino-4-deoxy-L-arabinose transferase-like glycosyltransferase
VSAVYALFMTLFGQTPFGVHLGLLIVNGACVWLVYLLAARTINRNAALLCCASYAALSLSKAVYGVFAHATQFVVLFALAGCVLFLHPSARKRAGLLFFSGLFFGLAFTMKQPAVFFCLYALAYFAWDGYRNRGEQGYAFLKGLAWLLLGMALPYLLIILWVLLAGSFDRFWFWTVSYASQYTTGLSFQDGVQAFFKNFKVIYTPQLPLWLLAAAGALVLLAGRQRFTGRPFIAGLTLCSFLALCPGLYFRWHYFILILPAVALLIGVAATAISGAVDRASGAGAPALGQLVATLLVMCAIGYGSYKERDCYFDLSPLEMSYSTYGASPFPAAEQIGDYLQEHTSASDRIAVFGSEPEILFYAGRLSATGHIYMYGMMENHPYALQMQQEMIRQVESSRPKYCVYNNMQFSWLRTPNSPRALSDWMEGYLNQYYEQVGVIEVYDNGSQCFWDADAVQRVPRTDAHLIVYRRKS